ncbi:MAG: hypothetical protein PVG49_10405 [Desulfobacteraceae bacterium]
MEGPRGEPGVTAKGNSGKSQRWTIMIMGRFGKMRSFKISPHLIFWSLLFLAVYLPASVLVFNRWVELRQTTRNQETRIDEIEMKLEKAERALFKFKQHVILLETYIESLEKQEMRTEAEPPQEAPAVETPPQEPETVEAASPQAEQAQEEEEAPAEEPELVDVEKLTFSIEPGSFLVDFNLTNIHRGEDPVSGYIHILASGTTNGDTWWEVYPRGSVENGLPVSYRVGQPFIIQRFKPVQGRFDIRPERGAPTTIHVVVYDDTGRLIYNTPFEVDHAS